MGHAQPVPRWSCRKIYVCMTKLLPDKEIYTNEMKNEN